MLIIINKIHFVIFFGQLHTEEYVNFEASAKWKEVKGKPGKINETNKIDEILKTKADQKEGPVNI